MSEIDIGGTISIALGSLFIFFLISCAGIIVCQARREDDEEEDDSKVTQNDGTAAALTDKSKRPQSQAYVTLPGGKIVHVPLTKTTDAEIAARQKAVENAGYKQKAKDLEKQKTDLKREKERKDGEDKQKKLAKDHEKSVAKQAAEAAKKAKK